MDVVDLVPNTDGKNVAFDKLSESAVIAKSEIRDGSIVVHEKKYKIAGLSTCSVLSCNVFEIPGILNDFNRVVISDNNVCTTNALSLEAEHDYNNVGLPSETLTATNTKHVQIPDVVLDRLSSFAFSNLDLLSSLGHVNTLADCTGKESTTVFDRGRSLGWSLPYLDDLSPPRCPHICLWKKGPDLFPQRTFSAPSSSTNLFELLLECIFSWSSIETPMSTIGISNSLEEIVNSNEDSHSGRIIQGVLHSAINVELVVFIDSTDFGLEFQLLASPSSFPDLHGILCFQGQRIYLHNASCIFGEVPL